MEVKKVMNIAVKAGEILLNSGAEIYRVEDTITRICRSYHITCECFVLPTAIFLSTFEGDKEVISTLKRIQQRTVDLKRIELINTFSRALEKNPLSYVESMQKLEQIGKAPHYSFLLRLISAGMIAYVYTLLFNGSYGEAAVAMLIGMLIYSVKDRVLKVGFFHFFEFFVSGAIAGGLSMLASKFIPGLDFYKIIIGAIMILVPGVALTNAIKDALYGDIVSSMFRISEVIFISAAVAVGVAVVLSVGLR